MSKLPRPSQLKPPVLLLPLALLLLGDVPAASPATPANANQRELTVVVVDAHADPSQPVQGVRVSLTFVAGAEKVVDARDATNRSGQALLFVSAEAAQRGDLRIEVTGASELVVFEPADGELNGLPGTVTIKLVPKGSPVLLGPAQIEAMLHRLSLQNKHLEQANREAKGELAAAESQKPDDLSAAMKQWAAANGFAQEEADKQVQQWAQDIQQRKDQATADQQALAELALKHYGAAAQLFDKAADDIGESLDDEEKRFLENRKKQVLDYVDKKFQSANTYALNLQYHQATQILEQTRDRAAAEHAHYPEDAALRSIWLEAIDRVAEAQVAEGEIAPAADSRALLAGSIDSFRSLLHEYAAPDERQSWAGTQSNLGVALQELGGRSSGTQATELLAQAVEAEQASLQVWTKANTPTQWAATQNDLAVTLLKQSEKSSGSQAAELLAQAAASSRAALQIFTKTDSPVYWGQVENNLGTALLRQALQSRGAEATDLSAQAAEAFRAALGVENKAEVPKDWATTQTNLGTVLIVQSRWESGAEATELRSQGIAAFQAALEVFSNSEMSQARATAQFDLGTALLDAGERGSGTQSTELLAQAVEAFKGSLIGVTKEDLPHFWGTAQNNLGNALLRQGERTSGAPSQELLGRAMQAYNSAMEVFTRTDTPQAWANVMDNVGLTFSDLADRSSGAQATQYLGQATEAFRGALEVSTKSDFPQDWAKTESNLGNALWQQGNRLSGAQAADFLAQAAQAQRASLEVLTKANQPQDWADSQNNLAVILAAQGVLSSGAQATDLLAQAAQANRAVLEVYTKTDLPNKWAGTQHNLGLSLYDQAEHSSPAQAAELLAQAAAAFKSEMEVRTRTEVPEKWAEAEKNLGRVYELRGDYGAAEATFESSLELLPTDTDLMGHLSNIEHENLFRFDRALELDQKRMQIHPSVEAGLDLEEASLTAGKFDGCLEVAGGLDDPKRVTDAGALIRDVIKLPCQWGAGKNSDALASDKALLLNSSKLQKNIWTFTGTLHYLAASAVFEPGRASWIAFFQSIQNGDSAAMAAALNQLQGAMDH